MKRWVGILSGLLGALACAFGVALLIVTIGWPVKETQMHAWLTHARTMPQALLLALFALIVGALGVLVLYGLFSAQFDRRTSAPIARDALGETSIAFSALSELSEQTVRSRADVKSCKAKVTAIGDDVRISVHVTTAPSTSLLALTHALQDAIRSRIQDVCGVQVGRVDVTVDQTDEPAADKRVQ